MGNRRKKETEQQVFTALHMMGQFAAKCDDLPFCVSNAPILPIRCAVCGWNAHKAINKANRAVYSMLTERDNDGH